ncbi:MAG: N-acetyltransferase [Selenomonadaceae bacterium]|nr:N-acetyltransferase [Selenomonadaceae bacterium]
MDDYTIRQENKSDYAAVENLVREAFWNVYRPGCLEHYVLHCFRGREDFVPELDLVLEKDGEIIGQTMYVRAEIELAGGGALPIMTFGPISIAPKFQRQGYGMKLLVESMNRAKNLGVGALAIPGNINFYGKAGFGVGKLRNIFYRDDPDAEYFLVKELLPDFLSGVTGTYSTPAGYFVDAAEAESFDRKFPPKQKLKLPTQIF